MKIKLLMSLCIALGFNIAESKSNEVQTPYYMKNVDSSKANAIKTNQANCGSDDCGGDCNNGNSDSIFTIAKIISLNTTADNYAIQNSCGCGNDNCGDDSIDLPSA